MGKWHLIQNQRTELHRIKVVKTYPGQDYLKSLPDGRSPAGPFILFKKNSYIICKLKKRNSYIICIFIQFSTKEDKKKKLRKQRRGELNDPILDMDLNSDVAIRPITFKP